MNSGHMYIQSATLSISSSCKWYLQPKTQIISPQPMKISVVRFSSGCEGFAIVVIHTFLAISHIQDRSNFLLLRLFVNELEVNS